MPGVANDAALLLVPVVLAPAPEVEAEEPDPVRLPEPPAATPVAAGALGTEEPVTSGSVVLDEKARMAPSSK